MARVGFEHLTVWDRIEQRTGMDRATIKRLSFTWMYGSIFKGTAVPEFYKIVQEEMEKERLATRSPAVIRLEQIMSNLMKGPAQHGSVSGIDRLVRTSRSSVKHMN